MVTGEIHIHTQISWLGATTEKTCLVSVYYEAGHYVWPWLKSVPQYEQLADMDRHGMKSDYKPSS